MGGMGKMVIWEKGIVGYGWMHGKRVLGGMWLDTWERGIGWDMVATIGRGIGWDVVGSMERGIEWDEGGNSACENVNGNK